jgi:hypothetical protein
MELRWDRNVVSQFCNPPRRNSPHCYSLVAKDWSSDPRERSLKLPPRVSGIFRRSPQLENPPADADRCAERFHEERRSRSNGPACVSVARKDGVISKYSVRRCFVQLRLGAGLLRPGLFTSLFRNATGTAAGNLIELQRKLDRPDGRLLPSQ